MKFYKLTVLTPTLIGDGAACPQSITWSGATRLTCSTRTVFSSCSRAVPGSKAILPSFVEPRSSISPPGVVLRKAMPNAGSRLNTLASHPPGSRHGPENLFIPTFCSGVNGPYLPASALKGALRTGYAFARWNAGTIHEIASRMEGERPLRKTR